MGRRSDGRPVPDAGPEDDVVPPPVAEGSPVPDPAPLALPSEGGILLRGDALATARRLPAGCLDLVYFDPPFGVGKRHRVLKGREGRFGLGDQVAYEDGNGLPAWLDPLLEECRRVLRPGGALFLHLDWRGAHRARLLLDRRFGEENFLNEIIWHYATGGIPSRWLARKHDTILFYRNGEGHTFHRLKEKKYLAHRACRAGVEEFHDARGWYRFRSLDDVWEIPWLTQDAKERNGYPTQKPLALLRRILEIATSPGDLVADFCCGSGTTAEAAAELGRRWIACDDSALAVELAGKRIGKCRPAEKRIELSRPVEKRIGRRAGEGAGPPVEKEERRAADGGAS